MGSGTKIILCCVLLTFTAVTFGSAQQGRNYYIFSPEDLRRIRESAQTSRGLQIMEGYRRQVEARMQHDMEVPTLEAGHGHFYVCPVHNVTFSFRWDHPTAHYCGACDKEYRGVNVYNWGWVNFVHAANSGFLQACMYLYMGTGDKLYAGYIRDMLLDYAGKYPDYMVHNVHRKYTEAHSGKMFGQSLDESVWLTGAARAYQAVRNEISARDADKIEKRLFREGAELLLRRRDGGNWQVWHNCALATLGVILHDDNIIDIAIDDPQCGYRHLADKHVYNDGWWNEGSPIYHFYPLNAMTMTADAVRCRGIDLFDRRFYNMFASPVMGTYPDLFFPAHNDGWYGESLVAQAELYEFAYARFGDSLFRDVLAQIYLQSERPAGYALLNPEGIEPAAEPMKLPGFRFEDMGFALLRSDAATVVMKYGPHGGGHGHPDKLSISVHNGDREILSDFGTSAYGAPDYTRWYRKTLSHNTVTVDGTDQKYEAGEFVDFDVNDKGGVIEATANNVYEGVDMHRKVQLDGNVLKDNFTCRSQETHRYDYVLLFNEPPVISGGGAPVDAWSEEPYRQIRSVKRYPFKRRFTISCAGSRITIVSRQNIEVFTGEASGIPPTNPGVRTKDGTERRPVQPAYPLIIRAEGKDLDIEALWRID